MKPHAINLVAAIGLLIVVLASVYRTTKVYHEPHPGPVIAFGLSDFHNAVYYPGLAFREGVNPYSAEYTQAYPVNDEFRPYSPGILLLHTPWSWLPLRVSDAAYFLATIALTGVLAALGVRHSRYALGFASIAFALTVLLVSRPGHNNLILGQVTLPIVLGMLGAIGIPSLGRIGSGVCLAAALLKPPCGLPLLMVAAARRQWTTCLVAICVSTVLAGAAVAWMAQEQGVAAFVEDFLHGGDAAAGDALIDPTTAWSRIDAMGLVTLATGWRPGLKGELAMLFVFATPLAIFAAWATRKQAAEALRFDSPLGAVLCCGALLCGYHKVYELLLLSPLMIILATPAAESSWRRLAGHRWVLLAILVVLHLNYLTTWSAIKKLGLDGAARSVVIAINPALLLAAIAVAVAAVLKARAATPEAGATEAV